MNPRAIQENFRGFTPPRHSGEQLATTRNTKRVSQIPESLRPVCEGRHSAAQTTGDRHMHDTLTEIAVVQDLNIQREQGASDGASGGTVA